MTQPDSNELSRLFAAEWLSDKDYITATTSGSTGAPKKIRLSKRLMRESARRTNDFFGITAESRLHSCVSCEYIAGKMMAVRSFEAQCILTAEIPSNQPLLNPLSGDMPPIDLLAVVPSQLKALAERKYLKSKYITLEGGKRRQCPPLPEIRNIIVGGAPVSEYVRMIAKQSGLNVYETYGMTETASHIALRKLTLKGTRPFVTMPDITVDTDGRGCLTIQIPGYEPIVTNDMARVTSPTTFHILGRIDNVIITGAKKVYPETIERKLNTFLNDNFMITSRPDDKWGEAVVLLLERNKDMDDKSRMEMAACLNRAARLRPEESIKELIIVDHFERTPNGKLKRLKL